MSEEHVAAIPDAGPDAEKKTVDELVKERDAEVSLADKWSIKDIKEPKYQLSASDARAALLSALAARDIDVDLADGAAAREALGAILNRVHDYVRLGVLEFEDELIIQHLEHPNKVTGKTLNYLPINSKILIATLRAKSYDPTPEERTFMTIAQSVGLTEDDIYKLKSADRNVALIIGNYFLE